MRDGIHVKLLSLDRQVRRRIIAASDGSALVLALWSGFALRTGEFWPSEYIKPAIWLFLLIPFSGVILFERLGLYREVIRFLHTRAIQAVFAGVAGLTLLLYAAAQLLQVQPFPRTVPLVFALTSLLYVGGTRLFIRIYYQWLLTRILDRKPVLIYGAGGNGVQLATSLSRGAEYLPVGFVDDDSSLWNNMVCGIEVFSPADLHDLIQDQRIEAVLVALPELDAERKEQIFETLAKYKVRIKTMPSLPEIISGSAIDSLRDIHIEDLLGRTPVAENAALISQSLEGKSVCVTGAGGSIGSEIARQVLRSRARRLVLIDSSEFNLYTINEELTQISRETGGNEPEIVLRLTSVQNRDMLSELFEQFGVDTVYHAAAYKHVPIVESNAVEGVRNNIFGTYYAAQAARDAKVKRFVLVSTDKAVRPTNVMGATKRFAELVLQKMSADQSSECHETCFSSVRFGNVLGSSGSVVPLFKRQIKAGGPVTVTHPEINRFFMTIQEAASLVIQASSLSDGGEVFVLDMGQPVRIAELAARMIKLSGYEVRDRANPDRGIEITYTGLRPGEKLYEELLIGDNVSGTEHPKIMRAYETRLDDEKMRVAIKRLEQAVLTNDNDLIVTLLAEYVEGYVPENPPLQRSDERKVIPLR